MHRQNCPPAAAKPAAWVDPKRNYLREAFDIAEGSNITPTREHIRELVQLLERLTKKGKNT